MGRLSFLLAASLLAPASSASAAFISSYSAEASAGFSFVGGSFADGLPGDALAALAISFVEDGFDDFPTDATGNAGADGTLVPTVAGSDGSLAASVSGGAGGPFGSSVATREGRLLGLFENTSDRAISLVFDFVLDVSATPFTTDSSAEARASYQIQNFIGEVFFREVSTFDPETSASGQADVTIAGGETGYSIVGVYAVGSATVFEPAPIPLGASLPLLASGLAALSLFGALRLRG